MTLSPFAIPPALSRDLRLAWTQQIPILLLTSMLLDGGDLARWTAAAVVGHWLGVAAILRKRAAYGFRTDRWFVRWGSLPLVVTGWVIEPQIHRVFH